MPRRLGHSDVFVPPLILGGNIFGHFTDEQATRAVIDAADEIGITAVDTADVYSDGKSEEWIGNMLAGRRDQWTILTKAGIRSNESPDGKYTAAYLHRAVDASLRRLQTEYIDVYQVHAFDPVTPLAETLGALRDLQSVGKIRAFGLSNFSGPALQSACALAPPVSLQVWWNVLDRAQAKEVSSICNTSAVSLLPYGTLARGLLTGKYQQEASLPADSRAKDSATLRADLTPERLEAVARLDEFARTRGYRVGHLACAWLLHQKAVAGCVVGVRSVGQLSDLIPGAQWKLTEDDCSKIDAILGVSRTRQYCLCA